MNRIDRVSAILIQLQSKKFVTCEEIASRFEISRRTVYRDIRALEEAGVPLSAQPGRGYFLVDGYRLPPIMFTPEEASSLLTAEKIVEKMADRSVDEHYKSAMYKIKAVLPEKDKVFLERINNNIEIYHTPPSHAEEAPNNFILAIQKALAEKKVLKLSYRAAYNQQLIDNRIVEPVGLCFYGLAWHLIAFCQLRNDYRDFRLDRIVSLNLGTENYQSREIKSVKDFFSKNISSYQLENITISLPVTESRIIQTTRYYYGYIGEEQKGNKMEMNFVSADLEYFCRWLLMYADIVEIVHNEQLQRLFSKRIEEIKFRFS